MGNTANQPPQSNKQSHDFVNFLTNFKKKSSLKESTIYTSSEESQQAWRQQFTSVLSRLTEPQNKIVYRELATVIKSIQQDRFVKARTILHFLDNQELKTISSKTVFKNSILLDVPRISTRVSIDINRPINNTSILMLGSTIEETNGGRQRPAKSIFLIMIRELSSPYHPVSAIRQAFVVMFEDKYILQLAKNSSPNLLEAQTKIFEEMHSDLLLYAKLVTGGCSKVYSGWALRYAGLEGQKYYKILIEAAMMTLFNHDEMYEILFLLVRSMLLKDTMPMMNYIRQDIPVGYFNLRQDLQINGQFDTSLQLLSQLQTVKNPKFLLKSLSNLKFAICNDIDNFHRQNNNRYHIDSDDLVGIVCYLMCRCKSKLLSIYCQMKILTIVYGDDMDTQFEESSYMHTVVEGTYDILNTKKFRQDMQH